MSIKITTNRQTGLRVSTQPGSRIQVNTGGAGGGSATGITTLVELKDVDAKDFFGNNTVVYDEASGKFKIEELPVVNGGTF